jgi:HKD family nuclease
LDSKRGKATIKTGNAPQNKTPLQTMEDKLRIANKVNKKYKELMNDLDADIKQTMDLIGNDEAQALLDNRAKVPMEKGEQFIIIKRLRSITTKGF